MAYPKLKEALNSVNLLTVSQIVPVGLLFPVIPTGE